MRASPLTDIYPASASSETDNGADIQFWIFIIYLGILFFQPTMFFPWMQSIRPAMSVACLVLVLAVIKKLNRNHALLYSDRLNRLMFLFYVGAWISMIKSISVEASLTYLDQLSKVCMLYALTVMTIRSELALKRVAWILVLFTTAVNLTSMVAYHERLLGYRMVSYFGGMGADPNDFGMIQVIILPFIVTLFRAEKSWVKRAFLVISILSVLYCVTRTMSRGTFISFVVVSTISLFRSRRSFIAILAICPLLLLLYMKTPASYWERVTTSFSAFLNEEAHVGSSIEARIATWSDCVVLIENNPILGVGIGNFIPATTEYEYELDLKSSGKNVAHNTFLEIAADSGLIRLGIFIYMILYALRLALASERSFRDQQNEQMALIAQGLFIGLVGYSACSMFLSQQFSRLLFILLGLAVVMNHLGRKEEKSDHECQREGYPIYG